MAGVRFEQVYKSYEPGVEVIRDLNLEVRDQELLVLVGPSGCGKSTVLRLVAGLETVTAGGLYIGDQRVNDVLTEDRDVAMVFQDYALYPTMSVRDNLAFGLKMRHTAPDTIAARVEAVARMLDIAPLLGRKPGKLSGGQRQRVALGRAVVREPRVYLLDEPLSSLDAQLRVRMRAEIVRLHQRIQTTMIYVTHDQTEAMTMGDRIAVLNAGVIQQLGTPQELYDEPANRFVAGFIGSPAMNFLPARLARAGDGVVARIGVGDQARTLALAGWAGKLLPADEEPAVVLGIRPEALHAGEANAAGALAGTVEVVEHLGSEQLVTVRLGDALADGPDASGAEGLRVTARLDAGARVRPGGALALAVDAARVHLFDPATGAAHSQWHRLSRTVRPSTPAPARH